VGIGVSRCVQCIIDQLLPGRNISIELKFLIIQTAFPGDVILATPVIEALHGTFPEARIDFLLRKGNESILEGHPLLNEVIVLDKGRKIASAWSVIRRLRRTRYDRVVNLQRFALSGLITALSGAADTAGFSKNPFSVFFTRRVKHRIAPGIHETDRNLSLVAGFVKDAVRPTLYPSDADRAAVEQFRTRPYVCLAPASVWFTKQLPAGQWAALARGILPGTSVYLIGGAADRLLAEQIRAASGNADTVNLCGELTWLQTAALMAGARMNYVNDSAPLHVASAMNAPVTAFFCSTVPAFGFGPLSDRSVVIETRENLPCRPCGLHGRNACPEGHFRCAVSLAAGTP